MLIAIDGNLMCGKKTGMGTTVYNVLKYWKSTRDYSFILYTPVKLEKTYMQLLSKNNIRVKILGKSNYFKWEQIILPRAIKKDKVDILWCPYNTAPIFCSAKIVVTVNDVIYMNSSLSSVSSLYKKMGLIYRKTIVPIAVKRAKKIITISEFAKQEIKKYFRKQKDKIRVIYLGIDFNNIELNEEERHKFFEKNKITYPYILGFGSLETRKNTMKLIKAFEKIIDNYNIKLVLFGFRGYDKSEEKNYIETNNLKEKIIVLGYVSDSEKTTLYKNSKMFVFPTLSEGFGIPVLEAFVNKTPVITSNVTSIPEIVGNSAVMVNPNHENDITDSILKLLKDTDFADKLVIKGEQQAAKFDWNLSSRKILEEILDIK